MKTYLFSGFVLAGAFALAAACATATQPPAGASGREIYELQLCANCHGDQGQGKSLGPPLRELQRFWEREALVEFLADPKAWKEDERMRQLSRKHSGNMAPYDNLSEQERGLLADYLFTL